MRSLGYITLGAGVVAGIAGAEEAYAQPSLDRVLTDAHVTDGVQCSVLRVNFNFPVRYISHFPLDGGAELHVRVRALEPQMDGELTLHRESLRLPSTDLAPIQDIEFEGNRPEGPTLDVVLSKRQFFSVGQGGDFRSLVIVLSGDKPKPDCLPTEPVKTTQPQPSNEATPPAVQSLRDRLALPPTTVAPNAAPDAVESQALLDSARAALLDKNNGRAIQLLTKLLQAPDSPLAPSAHELLGIARERNGQLAHAKAEFEEFLRLYPDDPGAERVRQRLSGLLIDAVPRPELREAQRRQETEGLEWRVASSLSQYYLRDDTMQTTADPVLGKIDDRTINQNEILTAVDASVSVRNSDFQSKLRVASTYTNDFRPDGRDFSTLSAAYLELADSKQRVLTRLGRQTRSTGGIFGRFDGGLLSLRTTKKTRFNITAGYPVESSKDLSLDSKRYFYGASVDIGRIGNWDGDVYYLKQQNHGLNDREAIGSEGRYVGKMISAFALLDYDIYFKQVNIGLFNVNMTLPDQTTISTSADYRRAPLLTAINALQGQLVGSLDELKASFTPDQIKQLAEDRTSYSRTGTISVSHPFNDRFAINADATVANMSGTKESGGVPANPATGNEYYYSAQLVGSSIFKEGDLAIAGVRYADSSTSNRYTVDLSARYPFTRDFRVTPRLRASYRENKNDDGTQVTYRPSIRMNYNVNRRFQLEFEGGGEFQHDDFGASKSDTKGFFVNVGYRVDF